MDKKLHFHGLDGLRFISITFVVLHHLFTFKTNFGFTAIDLPILGTIGYYGIQFFFAGSGFLITYLLLAEYQKYNTISLKYFYTRRILRIWPAYYLLIFLALIVALKLSFFRIPGLTETYLQSDYSKGNLLYLSFLPHIVPFVFPTVPYVHQTYTIGIEEQFYFLWGLLFFFVPRINYKFFIAVIVVVFGLNFLHDTLYEKNSAAITGNSFFFKSITYIKYSRFSTFSLGAIFAYMFFMKKQWLNVFKSIYFQLFIYLLLAVSIYFDWSIPYFRDEYIALVTLCVFGVATFKEDSVINFSAGWLSFLGKISYGIYLFHIFAIVFAIKICTGIFHFTNDTPFNLTVLIGLTMLLAIIFGYISYYTIEQFFLKIKKKFQKVES